jgi:hypothetical protein
MHPHEAIMLGLRNRAVRGEIRAMKSFLKECKQAGLLDAPPARQCNGVLVVPNGVPMEVACLLVKMVGAPPWDDGLYDRVKADYDRECAHIQNLLEKAKAKANEENP